MAVSVDPERDTPETLKTFAERLGIDLETWTFVTGSGVAELAGRYNVEVTRDETGRIDHRAVVFLIDERGQVAQTYSGSPVDRARLAREVEVLSKLVPGGAFARAARVEDGS